PPVVPGGAPAASLYDAWWRWDTPAGGCQTSGWSTSDLSSRVFGHVSSRFVHQTGFIAMGTKALWFGADSLSDPVETRTWPYSYGFGNNWSQRLVSPAFSIASHPNAVLALDATVTFTNTAGITHTDKGQEFLGVQGLNAAGAWV